MEKYIILKWHRHNTDEVIGPIGDHSASRIVEMRQRQEARVSLSTACSWKVAECNDMIDALIESHHFMG